MHQFALRGITVAALLFCASAVQAETTVDSLVASYQEARGGAQAWAKLKSVRMSGSMTMGPMQAPIRLEIARPGSVRMEFDLQGMTAIQAYDGKVGWAVMPFMGKPDPEPMAEDQLKSVKSMADIDGSLIDYASKGHKVSYAGSDSVEGTDAHKLEVVRADGDQETVWLDAEYFLPIKTANKMQQMGQTVEVSTSIGDYKEVEGLVFPHSINTVIGAGGQTMQQTVTIDKIEINVDTPAERFAMPASTKTEG